MTGSTRVLERAAVYRWAVVCIVAGVLAALLPSARWPQAPGIVEAIAVTLAVSVARLWMPARGHFYLVAAVAPVTIDLFGYPVAALVLAAGTTLGGVLPHRRTLARGLFDASRVALATLAAGEAVRLLRGGAAGWADLPAAGLLDPSASLPLLAAAIAFAAVAVLLSGGQAALEHRKPAADPLGSGAAHDAGCLLLMFLVGSTMAMFAQGKLTPWEGLLAVGLPAVGVAALWLNAGRQEAARTIALLYEAAADIHRARSADEVVAAVADGLDRLVAADIVIIWIRRPREEAFRVAYYRGPGGIEVVEGLGPGEFSAQAMRSGRAVRIEDHGRDPLRSPRVEITFGRGAVGSVLVAPMASGGEALGAVGLAKDTRTYFTHGHEQAVASVAVQAALALRCVHAVADAGRQAGRMEALRRIGAPLGTAVGVEEVALGMATRCAGATRSEYAIVSLVDHSSGQMRVEAVFAAEGPEHAGGWNPSDTERAAPAEAIRAAGEGRSVTSGGSRSATAPDSALAALPGARWAVAAPLLHAGRSLGALTVARAAAEQFSDEEVATVEAFALWGASAIENARACELAAARLASTEAAADTLRRLARAQDLRGAFEAAAGGTRKALGVERCALLLWEATGPPAEIHSSGLSDEFVAAMTRHLPAALPRYQLRGTGPILIPDIPADPRMGALGIPAAREGITSGAIFLLRANGGTVGTLALFGSGDRAFGSEVAGIAEALADAVEAAVARTTSSHRTDRRQEELLVLNRLVGSVSASLDIEEVFRIAAEELARAAGLRRVTIHRLAEQALRLAAQVGSPEAPGEVPLTSGITGRVARSGRPELVADVRQDPDHVARNYEVGSKAAVPIMQDGAVIGVLAAEGSVARPVTARTLDLLTAFAEQLGAAARNASVFAELRRAHDELQVLFEAAKAVSGTLDLHTLLDSLVSVACRSFGYETGSLLMVGAETGGLTVEAAYGYSGDVVGTHLPAGTGLSGWVAMSGSPLVADDVNQDSRYHRADARIRSELVVPLIAEGKVIGVFNVGSARLAAFGPRDMHLLATLASYAVIAIQNARLYEQARRLAVTDGLTELYNHRYFYEALERTFERSRRDGQPLALIMLEIDRFKHYNDTYGHKCGDDALREVAGLLRRGSRPSDIVARYGGDEFMVVLPGATRSAALEMAERLRRSVESHPLIPAEGTIATVTISVGVAAYPEDAQAVGSLVEAVDQAQYVSKRLGGNRVQAARDA